MPTYALTGAIIKSEDSRTVYEPNNVIGIMKKKMIKFANVFGIVFVLVAACQGYGTTNNWPEVDYVAYETADNTKLVDSLNLARLTEIRLLLYSRDHRQSLIGALLNNGCLHQINREKPVKCGISWAVVMPNSTQPNYQGSIVMIALPAAMEVAFLDLTLVREVYEDYVIGSSSMATSSGSAAQHHPDDNHFACAGAGFFVFQAETGVEKLWAHQQRVDSTLIFTDESTVASKPPQFQLYLALYDSSRNYDVTDVYPLHMEKIDFITCTRDAVILNQRDKIFNDPVLLKPFWTTNLKIAKVSDLITSPSEFRRENKLAWKRLLRPSIKFPFMYSPSEITGMCIVEEMEWIASTNTTRVLENAFVLFRSGDLVGIGCDSLDRFHQSAKSVGGGVGDDTCNGRLLSEIGNLVGHQHLVTPIKSQHSDLPVRLHGRLGCSSDRLVAYNAASGLGSQLMVLPLTGPSYNDSNGVATAFRWIPMNVTTSQTAPINPFVSSGLAISRANRIMFRTSTTAALLSGKGRYMLELPSINSGSACESIDTSGDSVGSVNQCDPGYVGDMPITASAIIIGLIGSLLLVCILVGLYFIARKRYHVFQ